MENGGERKQRRGDAGNGRNDFSSTLAREGCRLQVVALALLAVHVPVTAQVRQVFPQEVPAEIQLAPGSGATISFARLGERIERVWADNQTFFTLNSDGCLSGLEQPECDLDGATMLHLRRITRLDIPGIPPARSALLTVITDQSHRPYLFRIVPSETAGALVVEVVEPRRSPDWPLVAALECGIERALSQKLLTPNSSLAVKLRRLVERLRQGSELERAAAEAGVSLELVERLAAMGSGSAGMGR
ncbi:hypothetical protein [Lusitaniella coriacea]|uniref:hypothetical protein n=1 Tax=Lusitaniella coriacea TaxID=1983105 RepID=UPI003CEAC9B2